MIAEQKRRNERCHNAAVRGRVVPPGPTRPPARCSRCTTARTRNRSFWRLSALRTHTKVAYKIDLLCKPLSLLKRPEGARTVTAGHIPAA